MQISNGKERKTLRNQSLNSKRSLLRARVNRINIFHFAVLMFLSSELDFYLLQNVYPYTSNLNNRLIILSILSIGKFITMSISIRWPLIKISKLLCACLRLSYLFISWYFIKNSKESHVHCYEQYFFLSSCYWRWLIQFSIDSISKSFKTKQN